MRIILVLAGAFLVVFGVYRIFTLEDVQDRRVSVSVEDALARLAAGEERVPLRFTQAQGDGTVLRPTGLERPPLAACERAATDLSAPEGCPVELSGRLGRDAVRVEARVGDDDTAPPCAEALFRMMEGAAGRTWVQVLGSVTDEGACSTAVRARFPYRVPLHRRWVVRKVDPQVREPEGWVPSQVFKGRLSRGAFLADNLAWMRLKNEDGVPEALARAFLGDAAAVDDLAEVRIVVTPHPPAYGRSYRVLDSTRGLFRAEPDDKASALTYPVIGVVRAADPWADGALRASLAERPSQVALWTRTALARDDADERSTAWFAVYLGAGLFGFGLMLQALVVLARMLRDRLRG